MAKLAIGIALIFSLLVSSNANKVPALFSFGDSTMDPGNNNNLNSEAKANFPPYGEDFPTHAPTGRFCNGKLVTDYIAAALNLSDSLPAYEGHTVTKNDIGVSFASGGTGLDDWTANVWNVTTMSGELEQFIDYIGKMKVLKGDAGALEFIKKSVFVISVGTNDIMISYYLLPLRKIMYTLPQYHDFLLGRLKSFLQQLYALGVRNFAVAGLPPIGCVPAQMTIDAVRSGPIGMVPKFIKPKCTSEKNDEATTYNIKLQQMFEDLQNQFNSTAKSRILYVDIYNPLLDMAMNPAKYGFKETTKGCCGTGLIEMGPLCRTPLPTCENHSEYMFWDSVHPTQAAYEALAKILIEKNINLLAEL